MNTLLNESTNLNHMNNTDLGQAFETLKRNIFYSYGGVWAEMNNDGTVLYAGERMPLSRFHTLVDEKYDCLSNSIKTELSKPKYEIR